MVFLKKVVLSLWRTVLFWATGKRLLLVCIFGGLVSCQSISPTQKAVLAPRSAQPLLQSSHFKLFRLPDSYDAAAILQESEQTTSILLGWLNGTNKWPKVTILVYSPDEADGRRLLKKTSTTQVKGRYFFPPQNTLLLVGDPENPRFWTVLRHEVTHAAVIHSSSHTLPFWLNEGMATLFEKGIDKQGNPRIVSERLQMAKKLAKRRKGLRLKTVLIKENPDYQDGKAYAKAWSILYFLYQTAPKKTAELIISEKPASPFPFAFFGLASIEELEEGVTRMLEKLPE